MATETKVIALRNFSGAKGMILKGEIIGITEPYISDWVASGLCAIYIEPKKGTFKNMKTK